MREREEKRKGARRHRSQLRKRRQPHSTRRASLPSTNTKRETTERIQGIWHTIERQQAHTDTKTHRHSHPDTQETQTHRYMPRTLSHNMHTYIYT